AVVEAAAAGYAAERASDVDRRQRQEHFDAMIDAHERDDIDDIAKSDAEFHLAIYEASHNIMMLHFMRSLEGVLRSNVYLNRQSLYKHRAEPRSLINEHRTILDAILAKDVVAAKQAAQEHMDSAIRAQDAIHEAERRLELSIRRLSRSDLVVSPKGQESTEIT